MIDRIWSHVLMFTILMLFKHYRSNLYSVNPKEFILDNSSHNYLIY
jgi:hypothetical protein